MYIETEMLVSLVICNAIDAHSYWLVVNFSHSSVNLFHLTGHRTWTSDSVG